MRIIPASFQIEERNEIRGGIEIIERAGRTCYKSEDKAGCGKADDFVVMCIDRGHEAMLEHGDYIFVVDDEYVWRNIIESLNHVRTSIGAEPMLDLTEIFGRRIISGNIRAWREYLNLSIGGSYFSGHIDPVYTFDIRAKNESWFESKPDPRVHQIFYKDLNGRTELLTHQRQTVRFCVDRGVTHEIVRHRKFSLAQESTRFCNYSKGKFGSEITVIQPCMFAPDSEAYALWKRQCMSAEASYIQFLKFDCTPQEARDVLPHSTKAELVATGNFREWDHFFDLRAREVTGPVHPQMKEVALPLLEKDIELFPEVFYK